MLHSFDPFFWFHIHSKCGALTILCDEVEFYTGLFLLDAHFTMSSVLTNKNHFDPRKVNFSVFSDSSSSSKLDIQFHREEPVAPIHPSLIFLSFSLQNIKEYLKYPLYYPVSEWNIYESVRRISYNYREISLTLQCPLKYRHWKTFRVLFALFFNIFWNSRSLCSTSFISGRSFLF